MKTKIKHDTNREFIKWLELAISVIKIIDYYDIETKEELKKRLKKSNDDDILDYDCVHKVPE